MAETDDMSPEQVAELQKQNCIFCKIASKEIPSKILHETEKTICVLDINPATEGHLIVFPKEHYMILPHIPPEVNNELFKTVKLMSKTILKTMQAKGTSIFIANGMAAGQKAPHVLIHLFPRKDGDGLLQFEGKEIEDMQLKAISQQIKPYFGQILGDHASPIQVPAHKGHSNIGSNTKIDIEENDAEKNNVVEENNDVETNNIDEDEIEEREESNPKVRSTTKKIPDRSKGTSTNAFDENVTEESDENKNIALKNKTNSQKKPVDLDAISKLFG